MAAAELEQGVVGNHLALVPRAQHAGISAHEVLAAVAKRRIRMQERAAGVGGGNFTSTEKRAGDGNAFLVVAVETETAFVIELAKLVDGGVGVAEGGAGLAAWQSLRYF